MSPADVEVFPWELRPRETVCQDCHLAHHDASPCPECST